MSHWRMLMNLFYLLYITALNIVYSFCENTTKVKKNDTGSFHSLQQLINCAINEEHIFTELKQSMNSITDQLTRLQGYYEEASKVSQERTSHLISHLIKKPKLQILNPTKNWPTPGDLNNTILGLTSLHRSLRVPLETLPQRLSGGKVVVPLNAAQAAQIAFYAMDQSDFDLAVEWIELSKFKVEIEADKTLTLQKVQEYLEVVFKTHNEALLRLDEYFPVVFEEAVEEGQASRAKRQLLYMEDLVGDTEEFSVQPNVWALCSGQVLQSARELSRLNCYLEKKGGWALGPLKIEQLSSQVLRIHEFLGEKEVETIKGSQRVLSKEEVKKSYFFETWVENNEVDILAKKVELFSEWNVNVDEGAAEPLRVIEYVVGRYNETKIIPHEDHAYNPLALTFLFYLNDVEEGGETAFGNQLVSAAPLKGSAVVFCNYYRNGSHRTDMFHSACPVIYGHKIVANKWLIYEPQFRKWPCSLDPNE